MVGGLSRRRFSFQVKALIPVITIMVLLVGVTMVIVNRHFTARIKMEAEGGLVTAHAVFRDSRDFHRRHQRSLNRQVSNEPKIIGLTRTDAATVQHNLREDLLPEISKDIRVDALLFINDQGVRLGAVARDPQLDLAVLEERCQASIERCLNDGQASEDTVAVGNRLFDVVSAPIFVGKEIIGGVLTFASEAGQTLAEQFKELTGADFVFVTEDRVTTATALNVPFADREMIDAFRRCVSKSGAPAPVDLQLGGNHFLCLGGQFRTLDPASTLGYVLLSSYEGPLRELQATHRMLLTVGLLGILIGSAILWLLMERLTRPLRELRDGAEAVGRGDFSRRVPVTSNDECGELAHTFNQMTENLQTSRHDLEKALQTLHVTQAQLVQSEKMSAMGQFVAGIAHELNNPLTVVIGYTDLLQMAGHLSDDDRDNLAQISASADRCRKIVRGLLSFARQQKPERRWVNINEILDSSVALMAYDLRTSNVQIARDLEPNLPKVLADPHQMEQVFVNIINNARQAIGGTRIDGQIRLTTEAKDRSVRINFEDNGPGIPGEHLPKIFNPFFTTKEVGQGTGLGLSLSYGIVQEHGGTIIAANRPAGGARFTVELPVAFGGEVGVLPIPVRTLPVAEKPRGTGKKVLVIDDETSIIAFARKILERSGFEVQTTPDGTSGLQMLRASDFDVVLCDLRMPGLSGQEVFRQVHSFNARAASRFIFMTGDVINEKTQQFLKETGQLCLAKPFSMEQFQAAVEKVLKQA